MRLIISSLFVLLIPLQARAVVLTGSFDYHVRANPNIGDFPGSYDFTATYIYDSETNTGTISGFVQDFGIYTGGGEYSFTRRGGPATTILELNPYLIESIAWDLSSTDNISFGRIGRLTDTAGTANIIGLADLAPHTFNPVPPGATVARGEFDPLSFPRSVGIPEPDVSLLGLLGLGALFLRRYR